MTVGRPWLVLLRFSLPLLLSSMFQQFYNIADSVIAGRFIGENALAAIGSSFPITMIFMAIALGASQGSSVVISQFFGAKKLTEMKTTVYTAFIFIFSMSIVLTLAGVFLCRPIIMMMKTPQIIVEDSVRYLSVYIYGLVFLYLYNAATSVFASLGDSKTPLILLICSSIGNIILDLIFVTVFGWGVEGLAVATLIAQCAASVSATLILKRRLDKIATAEKPQLFSLMILGKISRMAIPNILQQSFVSVGNLFIQSIINSFGQAAIIAGYSAAIRLNTFGITSFITLSSGVSNFTAQNVGAGKNDRVKKGFLSGVIMAESVAVIFILIIMFFGKSLILFFMDEPSETALNTGVDFLRTISPFYLFICVKLVSDSVLRGAGAVKCFMLSTFSDLIFRVVLAYIFTPFMGVNGVWWSWPVGWGIATAVSVYFYFKGHWKYKNAL